MSPVYEIWGIATSKYALPQSYALSRRRKYVLKLLKGNWLKQNDCISKAALFGETIKELQILQNNYSSFDLSFISFPLT